MQNGTHRSLLVAEHVGRLEMVLEDLPSMPAEEHVQAILATHRSETSKLVYKIPHRHNVHGETSWLSLYHPGS